MNFLNYIVTNYYPLFSVLASAMIGYGVYGIVNRDVCEHENFKTDKIKIENKTHYKYTCTKCNHVWTKKTGRPNKK